MAMPITGNKRRINATTVSLTDEQSDVVEEMRKQTQLTKAAVVRILINRGMEKPNPTQLQSELVNNIYVQIQRTLVLFYRWMEQDLAREGFSAGGINTISQRFAEMAGLPLEILSTGRKGSPGGM